MPSLTHSLLTHLLTHTGLSENNVTKRPQQRADHQVDMVTGYMHVCAHLYVEAHSYGMIPYSELKHNSFVLHSTCSCLLTTSPSLPPSLPPSTLSLIPPSLISPLPHPSPLSPHRSALQLPVYQPVQGLYTVV